MFTYQPARALDTLNVSAPADWLRGVTTHDALDALVGGAATYEQYVAVVSAIVARDTAKAARKAARRAATA